MAKRSAAMPAPDSAGLWHATQSSHKSCQYPIAGNVSHRTAVMLDGPSQADRVARRPRELSRRAGIAARVVLANGKD